MDDVIFAHMLRLPEVAARLRQRGSHASRNLGLGTQEYPLQAADARDYFWQSGPRPQVTLQVATPGAESAVRRFETTSGRS